MGENTYIYRLMVLRLARWSGKRPGLWLGLQNHYDLEVEENRVGALIEREVHPLASTV